MKVIKLAIRSILSFRMYSGVNLLGLALSLACVITIFRYVYGEFTVDHFNKKLDRVYVTTVDRGDNPGNSAFSGVTKRYGVDLTEHPGVEKYSHFVMFGNDEIDFNDRKYVTSILSADSNFLEVTGYPVISGVENLSNPNSALITQSYARKLFGDQNPVGQTFRHSSGDILTVTGVIGQTSTKSTLAFDVIVSFYLTNTPGGSPQTFVLLYPDVDYQEINRQYETFFTHAIWDIQMRYQLYPLSKVYFAKGITDYSSVFRQGNYNYVNVLTAVGILILLAGIINYINIYTVVILRRGRELGIKKVFGAERYNIFMQLFVESLLMTGLALISGFYIAHTVNPLITNVLHLDQILNFRFDLFLSSVLLLCIPLISTLYPFFRYHYSTVVNSIQNFEKIRSTGSLRRVFLSFQYVITIVMITVSLFFVKQLQFMLNTEPGYRTNDIIKVQFIKQQKVLRPVSDEDRERENRFADEIVQKMNACPLFTNWTYGESPNKFRVGESQLKLPEGEFKNIKLIGIDACWLSLFDIQLADGRLWDDEIDMRENNFFIVSESALKLYGITDFNNALLQPESRLWYGSGPISKEDMAVNPPYRIVGVIKDFDYLHLSQKSAPIVFHYSKGRRTEPLVASIVPGRTQEAIAFLRKLHDETVGGEYTYSFVEDEVREMYREDKKIASIYSIFTFIAIFISALGLLSMSLFDVQQRRREIAIRKVNGATVADIIRLLLKKYFWSLAVSFVIAAPVALLAINRYLEDFAHKAPVSWWLFAVAIVLTASISLLTLIYQTQKAASQNPADVVKIN